MNTAIERKHTSFRLRTDLLKSLKKKAEKENVSLNSYVESLLMDDVYCVPNTETVVAIEEARAGKYAGTLDMSSFDAFMKSVNDIE